MADKNRTKNEKTELSSNIADLAEKLISSSRLERQNAAASLAAIAKEDAQSVLPHCGNVLEAIHCPEARTRWEAFDILSALVELNAEKCSDALEYAEESLFDEDNGTVRLAALRFICKLGMASAELARQAWPLIDEVLQCFHGDPEYIDMLIAVNDFAFSRLPEEVQTGIIERLSFDATNAKSGMMRRAKSIIEAAKDNSGENAHSKLRLKQAEAKKQSSKGSGTSQMSGSAGTKGAEKEKKQPPKASKASKQPDMLTQTDKSAKSAKSAKGSKQIKAVKPAKTVKASGSTKAAKSAKSAKGSKPAKPVKSSKSTKAAKSTKGSKGSKK